MNKDKSIISVLALALLTILSGCARSAPSANSGSDSSEAKTAVQSHSGIIKQNVICQSNGTDGYLAPYSIEYQLNFYSDNTTSSTCKVIKGSIQNLTCPSTQLMTISYSYSTKLTQGPNGFSYTYWMPRSETFSYDGSNCTVINY